MADLPEKYCEKMKSLLGEEYGEYLECFSMAPHTAYRVNTGKVSLERWNELRSGSLLSDETVPWCEKGFFYDAQVVSPAKSPWYYAGLYYIQEPSAMIPAAILPVEPGDMVLDLCAAPGGKATELGSRLRGTGFLVANDVSASRAMALTKNIQMAGIANALVTAETPERLEKAFPVFFDKILVDAPCSGEGMFRREPHMVKNWLERGPEEYAVLQQDILEHAYHMLKPGGKMVYSTCTFSVQEDEETVNSFLQNHPDMKICSVPHRQGFSPGRADMVDRPAASLEKCIRLFPHRAPGEGHFAVLLEKDSSRTEQSAVSVHDQEPSSERAAIDKNRGLAGEEMFCRRVPGADLLKNHDGLEKRMGAAWNDIRDFLKRIYLPEGTLTYEKDTLIWHSFCEPKHGGLRVIYGGLPVCHFKHKVQPAHQLALILREEDYDSVYSLSEGDEQLIRYLKGETMLTEQLFQGNVLVCVDGYGLGWCQGNGRGMLKNKYHAGWRYQ